MRPVIGIPYSLENAALFYTMMEGTTFTLQMNTGAALRFVFEQHLVVSRSDTGIFRQVGPGLVLALIGEHDIMGAPTATRIVITATYAPDQELARDGALTGLLPTVMPTLTPTPSPTLPPLSQLDVQIISVTTVGNRVIVQLRLYNNGMESIHIMSDTIWMVFGYVPNPLGSRIPADGLVPFVLLPAQTADITISWVWSNEQYGILSVGMYQYELIIGR